VSAGPQAHPRPPIKPRYGVWVPLFDDLADPALVASLAADAERAGWDGFFVWDQLAWRAPVLDVADPWITLAAIATATERIALGPMVTPLPRRRPAKVARESVTLDRLCGGRLILGVGSGSDRFAAEYSRTGEPTGDRHRADLLDESLSILRSAWTGESVQHDGPLLRVDGMAFSPRPVNGSIPVWVAAFPGNRRPLRRAARHDGFFPVNLGSAAELAEALAYVEASRSDMTDPAAPFDVVAAVRPDHDPAPYLQAGATWVLTDIEPTDLDVARLRRLIRNHGTRS